MRGQARVFVLGGDEPASSALVRALQGEGHEVVARSCADGAIEAVRSSAPDLVLLHATLADRGGLDLLPELAGRGLDCRVVVLGADGSAGAAVRAMKLGAADYLTRPFDVVGLTVAVAALLEEGRQTGAPGAVGRRSAAGPALQDLVIGTSAAVRRVRGAIEKLAGAGVHTVLVTGESGTGKDLAARSLHRVAHPGASGPAAPFIAINCAAMPESLVESELFGHERGAFTDAHSEKQGVFEQASGGTILLDEIGEMALPLQAKLLRVLEERTVRRLGGRHDLAVDATVVATTNRDLGLAVERGEFRADLFYRLSAFSIRLPALRHRREDLPDMARHFLATFAVRYGRPAPLDLSPEAERLLLAYAWPGNVRELRNVMERLAVLERGTVVLPEHLPLAILHPPPEVELAPAAPPPPAPAGPCELLPPEGLSLDALERSLIEQAMARTHGNKAHAARLLGMTYDAIRYQVKRHGLEPGEEHGGGAPSDGTPPPARLDDATREREDERWRRRSTATR